jgi:acetaldehyde dehydrogenase (acetylating)
MRAETRPAATGAGELVTRIRYAVGMSGVTDLEIYQRLTAIADEFDQLTARGVSIVGGVALGTACRSLRGMAAAIYEHSLATDPGQLPQ